MNLLHFLYSYRDRLAITISIAHVNHKQRPESDEEEAYLRQWAQDHQVPIFVSYFQGTFSEKAARDFRYRFFEQVMREHGITALTTAHHADDQAETVLMRIIKGSRLRHLAAIKSVQPFAQGEVIRPFLPFSKSDLPSVFHFEDSSNQSSTYFRNRIRNHYIPELVTENPQFQTALTRLASESQTLFQAFADLTRDIDGQSCSVFLAQTPAVQELLLQGYLEQFEDLSLSHGQFEDLLQVIRNPQKADYALKEDYVLKKREGRYEIKRISPKTDLLSQDKVLEYGNIATFDDYQISFNQVLPRAELIVEVFSDSPILLRRRQSGDRIDFGDFSKKLRRLFIDQKVSKENRQKAIVGEQDGEIIFVLVAGKTYLRKPPKHGIMKAKIYIES